MKGTMFCASQASTATVNHDERSVMARAIDRHNPIIKDGRRSFTAPCSSGDDYIEPYRQLSKITRIPSSPSPSVEGKMVQVEKGRKSTSGSLLKLLSSSDNISLARKSFGCFDVTKSTPAGSTRYLLGTDAVTLSGSSTGKDVFVTEEGEPSEARKSSGAAVEEKKKKTSSGSDQQVVVLRVSLHCQCRGCEGKVKKHLSRMQGVTSFNIDLASKKVTVTGDITPLQVLGCLSKVKNAQFWTPPPPSSLSSTNPEN
ncbi:Chloroplast-targeted copper chaperone protein [Raphanus sativus]|uniref:Protein SODIUM POTASSIUM ROOT DEFECTIVE 3 n=1 Tax=Raphanus sativus TaxID=3726 RepID=A0A6J0P4J1_RAPSA|nr:protein SODIUM POTASSIUM ROOT DEFECTIVE 3 [Raphanus sativus]KAJ4895748.1 Chloroplast-targeted copper chaperone protein [Raphanus sativus]